MAKARHPAFFQERKVKFRKIELKAIANLKQVNCSDEWLEKSRESIKRVLANHG